jgi:hypothetical protein
MRTRAWLGALVLVAAAPTGPARAGLIVNQTPTDGDNVISQVFPNQPTSTTFAFDDFVTAQAYSLTALTVLGTERGDPTQNLAVTAEIWSGLPGAGSRVQAFAGFEDGGGTLHFDLGHYVLPAGSYWLTAYVTRPVPPTGPFQWFIDTYSPVTGMQAQLYNPGNGFGFGTDPFPIRRITPNPEDLAFTLSGDAVAVFVPVPEPGTLLLFALGTVAVAGWRRWRKHRCGMA